MVLKWSVIAAKDEETRRESSDHRSNRGKSNWSGLLQLQRADTKASHFAMTTPNSYIRALLIAVNIFVSEVVLIFGKRHTKRHSNSVAAPHEQQKRDKQKSQRPPESNR